MTYRKPAVRAMCEKVNSPESKICRTPVRLSTIAATILAALSAAPAAASDCAGTQAALTELNEQFGEQAIAVARSLDDTGVSDGVMVLTANSERKTWTVLIVDDGRACIHLFGDGLEPVREGSE